MKGHLDIKELESYKKADLQKLAKELGVSDAGTIKEIAARCAAVEVDIPEESELTEEEKTAAAEAGKSVQREEKAAVGMVKVEITTRYLDKSLNQIKGKGETLTVSKERAAQLVNAKVAKIKE